MTVRQGKEVGDVRGKSSGREGLLAQGLQKHDGLVALGVPSSLQS